MHSKLLLVLGGSSVLADLPSPRAVRPCDQTTLPALSDAGAQWDCMGNSCGVDCPDTGRFYKNQVFCDHDLTWKITSQIAISDIRCDRWPRSPKFAPSCDIDTSPEANQNGDQDNEPGAWRCDKRYNKCKLKCDNMYNSKTVIVCDKATGAWTLKGKNSCTPPVPRVCDPADAPDFGVGVLTCTRGKSCALKCNDFTINGALTCRSGAWEKRKEDMACCDKALIPVVDNSSWKCKEKKYSHSCRLMCDSGYKARTMLKCVGSTWEQTGDGVCQ